MIVGLAYYAQNFAYYAFEHCSKNYPIILNIMLININYVTVQV